MTAQEKLYKFATETAYPYILQLPFYLEYREKISILLVGSTATGLCTDTSDVDICLLCKEQIFNDISEGTNWVNGRPTEILIDDIQLHYYAIGYEAIEKKILEYDDISFYVYGNAIALNDNSGLYSKIKNIINDDEIKIKRKNKAIDMLSRRNRALKQILSKESDPILRINIGLEIIELILTAAALLDSVQFDRRKRFYTTALSGKIGNKIIGKVDTLINILSNIGKIDDSENSCIFMQIVDECINSMQCHE